MKVKELIKKLQTMPQDYDVTYINNNIGHIILSPKQITAFDSTKEVLIETQILIKV